ncbi:hypothetical protein [Spirochaeta lutea]|uniref:Uncharacterized protein n=1 Tax=Spirochaeta lutea TaxID=1480694 RepID=A0A098QV06_9SPIO|nr:hypothetical protein [Spirochaeta lutea]KGE71569.1 hypothetical protein DC28_09770 [Spirochaeta lutea]
MTQRNEASVLRLGVLLVLLLSLGLPGTAGGGAGRKDREKALESPRDTSKDEELKDGDLVLEGELRVVRDGPGSRLILVQEPGVSYLLPREWWDRLWEHQGRRIRIVLASGDLQPRQPGSHGPGVILGLKSWVFVE